MTDRPVVLTELITREIVRMDAAYDLESIVQHGLKAIIFAILAGKDVYLSEAQKW